MVSLSNLHCAKVLNGIYKLQEGGIISVVKSKTFYFQKFCI